MGSHGTSISAELTLSHDIVMESQDVMVGVGEGSGRGFEAGLESGLGLAHAATSALAPMRLTMAGAAFQMVSIMPQPMTIATHRVRAVIRDTCRAPHHASRSWPGFTNRMSTSEEYWLARCRLAFAKRNGSSSKGCSEDLDSPPGRCWAVRARPLSAAW